MAKLTYCQKSCNAPSCNYCYPGLKRLGKEPTRGHAHKTLNLSLARFNWRLPLSSIPDPGPSPVPVPDASIDAA